MLTDQPIRNLNDGRATEGLARKKRIRAGHKASATRILSQVDEILAASDPGSAVDMSKLTQLKLSLQEKLETLKQLDGEILELTEEAKLEDEIGQADSYKEGIYSAMVKIDKLCLTTPTPSPAAPPSAPPAGDERTRSQRVRLPKLTLRSFNGDITTWTTFWDSYESAIHKSPDLSDIVKFNYLKSLLERTALEAISGLTLTSDNYHEAISTLKKNIWQQATDNLSPHGHITER